MPPEMQAYFLLVKYYLYTLDFSKAFVFAFASDHAHDYHCEIFFLFHPLVWSCSAQNQICVIGLDKGISMVARACISYAMLSMFVSAFTSLWIHRHSSCRPSSRRFLQHQGRVPGLHRSVSNLETLRLSSKVSPISSASGIRSGTSSFKSESKSNALDVSSRTGSVLRSPKDWCPSSFNIRFSKCGCAQHPSFSCRPWYSLQFNLFRSEDCIRSSKMFSLVIGTSYLWAWMGFSDQGTQYLGQRFLTPPGAHDCSIHHVYRVDISVVYRMSNNNRVVWVGIPPVWFAWNEVYEGRGKFINVDRWRWLEQA